MVETRTTAVIAIVCLLIGGVVGAVLVQPPNGKTATSRQSTPNGGNGSSLNGYPVVWMPGKLVSANRSSIILSSGGSRVRLNGTGEVLFAPQSGGYSQVQSWSQSPTGVQVCIATKIDASGSPHVIKAFYNTSCSPTAAVNRS